MPDKKGGDSIDINLLLDYKDFQEGIKKSTKEIGKFKTFAIKAGSALSGVFKKQKSDIDNVSKAEKKSADEFKKREKEKQESIKKTVREAEQSQRKLSRLGALGRGVGMGAAAGAVRQPGFVGGFMGGAGLGSLRWGNLTRERGRGEVGESLGRAFSGSLGGVIGFAAQGLASAFQQYVQYGMARGGLIGLGTGRQLNRPRGMAGGAGLGYGLTETVTQAGAVGRATGNIGAVYRAQQFNRAYGLDMGDAIGGMGMVRQAGYGFGGQTKYGAANREGTKVLTEAIEAGMISGLEKGRLPEFLSGVNTIAQQVGGSITGKVNIRGIASFMALLGSTGKPGFQGARGAAFAGGLAGRIRAPGGGEAGQALVLQAMGFGKPGGQTPYYEAVKRQERGLQDTSVVRDIIQETYRQFGAAGAGGTPKMQQEANLALRELLGVTLDQAESLGEIYNSNVSSEEQQKKIEKILAETKDPQKKAVEEMGKGFGGVIKTITGFQDRQIAIGSKTFKIFTMIEDLQIKALKLAADKLPAVERFARDTSIAVTALGEMISTKLFGSSETFTKHTSVGWERLARAGNVEAKMLRGKPPLEQARILEELALGHRQEAAQVAASFKKQTIGLSDIMELIAAGSTGKTSTGVKLEAARKLEADNIERANKLSKKARQIRDDEARKLYENPEASESVKPITEKPLKTSAVMLQRSTQIAANSYDVRSIMPGVAEGVTSARG